MFEIGSSLRDTRVRRGLDLAQVERDTKIRGRYLAALEDDDFDSLPGPAYARGFLRTYADYLGLDSQRFVDEYYSRFAPPEDVPAVAPGRSERPGLAVSRWLAAAAIVAAALVALIAWQLTSGSGGREQAVTRPPTTTTTQTRAHTTTTTRTRTAVPALARITVAATRGACWLSVHLGSATGPFVWEGTLEPGRTVHFVSKRLWMRFGAPGNVDAQLNGRPTVLPTQTSDVVVTPRGISTPTSG